MITPFKEDDSVDYDALLRLVDYQLQNGTDFLCVLGTTAETPTLTKEEKDKIKRLIIERVNGRIPILLGVSSNCTRAVVETLKNDDMTGVDAVLVAVPYYNKPSQEGIYQHYKAIAEATDLPVVLYNVPGRTGVNMTAETTLRLARDFKNIIAIKEASGNITQMDDIIKNKPANFDVISGDDGITFPLITLGAVGVISVIGNAFPREFSRMTRLALQGDFANALTIHHKFTELFSLLFVDGNPAGSLTLDIVCSKGTYVRTLLEDIAAELGMCGTMSFLLRKQVGDFYLSEAKTLEEIAAAPYAYLLPAEAAVQDLQELVLTDKQALRITQGVKTTVRGISNGTYRLKTITGDFLGIGSAESELVKAEKILKQFQADAEMI